MLGKRLFAAAATLLLAALLAGCSADAFNPALEPARNTPSQIQQNTGQSTPTPQLQGK